MNRSQRTRSAARSAYVRILQEIDFNLVARDHRTGEALRMSAEELALRTLSARKRDLDLKIYIRLR